MTLDPDLVRAFYVFMIERESIRQRRLAGLPREKWTDDPILQQFSFTNVKREHDRTTMGLRVIYDRHRPVATADALSHMQTILLNCVLYRYFGTVAMAEAIGWTPDWNQEQSARIQEIAETRLTLGEEVFTGSYIVPNCGSTAPKHVIVCQIVSELWPTLLHILDTDTWQEMCERLCQSWGVGPFMAKEVLLDFILATGWIPADWDTWTPVGPGGKRGASRVAYGGLKRVSSDEALSIIREIYAMRGEYWPKDFAVLSLPDLDLTDVQFQLCEYDKYSRVAEGRRPKRLFRPTIDAVTEGLQSVIKAGPDPHVYHPAKDVGEFED